jgi:hypothetical protein
MQYVDDIPTVGHDKTDDVVYHRLLGQFTAQSMQRDSI